MSNQTFKSENNIDQIRELVFGATMRDYERRFKALNKQFRELKAELDKKFENMKKTQIRHEDETAEGVKKLNARLEDLHQESQKALATLQAELLEKINLLQNDKTDRLQRANFLSEVALVPSATVLLQWESGTNKNLVARIIHYSSHKTKAPLIEINCPTIPEVLLRYTWPGNVRELRNVIERAMIFADGGEFAFPAGEKQSRRRRAFPTAARRAPSGRNRKKDTVGHTENEARETRTRAAELLHLSRDTFRYRLKKIWPAGLAAKAFKMAKPFRDFEE